MLRQVQVNDMIERLAEHAIDSNLTDAEISGALRKRYLEIVLDLEGGNQCAAARRLRIHRNTLSRRLDEYGIAISKHGRRDQ